MPKFSFLGSTGTSGSLGVLMSVSPSTLTTGTLATITNCAITNDVSLPAGLTQHGLAPMEQMELIFRT